MVGTEELQKFEHFNRLGTSVLADHGSARRDELFRWLWPFRRVKRTEPGVVMVRDSISGLFTGPREFEGFKEKLDV